MTAIDWVAVQAIATIATGLILAVSLIFAAKQVRHARQLREDQIRPYVVIDMAPHPAHRIIELTVQNMGATAAYDVELRFEPSLESAWDKNDRDFQLKDSALIREGIPTLPPGRRHEALFDNFIQRSQTDLPMRYEATAAYTDAAGKRWSDRYTLDLTVYRDVTYIDRKDVHDAAEALREIQKTLKQWTQGFSGVRVFAQDYERYAWRNGLLIRHPNLVLRWAHQVVKRLFAVDLHPSERRRQRRRRISQKQRQ